MKKGKIVLSEIFLEEMSLNVWMEVNHIIGQKYQMFVLIINI